MRSSTQKPTVIQKSHSPRIGTTKNICTVASALSRDQATAMAAMAAEAPYTSAGWKRSCDVAGVNASTAMTVRFPATRE